MKYKILIAGLIAAFTSMSQCDYTAASPFPSTLTLNSGDTLCVSTSLEVTTSIQVNNGGVIAVNEGSTFKVNGSINVAPGGLIYFDCTSKLEVAGTYVGVYGSCELKVLCICGGVTTPLTLLSGAKVWDEWCCEVTLPVELITFSAHEIMKGRNSITWTTASQINNWYFEVEKSRDGREWEVIIQVSGDNSRGMKTYGINDLARETTYYRLKQVDFDGATSYSNVVGVRRGWRRSVIRRINFIGQSVGERYKGGKIVIYNDGSREIVK